MDKYALIEQLRALLAKLEVRGPVNGRLLDLVDRGLQSLAEGLRAEEGNTHANDHNGPGQNL